MHRIIPMSRALSEMLIHLISINRNKFSKEGFVPVNSTKKNFLNIPNSYTYKIDLTLKFFIKENKYRIQISPITWTLITEKYALRKVNVEGKPNYLEEIGVEALEQYKLDRTNKDHIIDINYYSKLCNLIVTDIQALLEYSASSF